jgi:hypothetical protein
LKLIEEVNELVTQFMSEPQYVMLNLEHMTALAHKMLETGVKPFPPESSGDDKYLIVFKELAATAINYCYWYGSPNIRPNNANSGMMYELVDEAFGSLWDNFDLQLSLTVLQRLLVKNRFPLVEDRIRHLEQLRNSASFVDSIVQYQGNLSYSFFEDLAVGFPGYGSDMFLKRASLFFLQLYRTLGWHEDAMQWLPVPADYQVPKMLRHFGCFTYLDPLKHMVDHGTLVPKHSRMECEIRAATIAVCKFLQIQTEWNISEIDSWLWLRRKEATEPFHLTITTDY